MKTALELLKMYLDNVQTPAVAAAAFADDGVLELPTVNVHVVGPAGVERLVAGLLTKIPDFRFKNLKVWIDTPDKAFAEYSVEAIVAETNKRYVQTYAGFCVAENGKIKLLREALDTAASARAFSKD